MDTVEILENVNHFGAIADFKCQNKNANPENRPGFFCYEHKDRRTTQSALSCVHEVYLLLNRYYFPALFSDQKSFYTLPKQLRDRGCGNKS